MNEAEIRAVWPELATKIDAGLLAFIECDHGDGLEWVPASVRCTPLVLQAGCAICIRPVDYESLSWLTEQDAAQRHGWVPTTTDSVVDPPTPSSRRLRGEQIIQ